MSLLLLFAGAITGQVVVTVDATADVTIQVRGHVDTISVRPDVGTIQVRPDVGEVDV